MRPDQTPDELGEPSLDAFMPPRAKRARPATRYILFAGVAGASVLGVGLGLWARPALSERQARADVSTVETPKPVAANRKLQIVVDDHPATVGPPIDVLPASTAPHSLLPPPIIPPVLMKPAPAAPSPQAPVKRDVVRVKDAAPPVRDEAPSLMKPSLTRLVVAALSPTPKLVTPKPKAAPPAHKQVAKAAAPAKVTHKVDLARAAAAKAQAHRIEVAEAAKEAKAEKMEKARLAKAAHQQQILLAKAEAKGRAEALAQAKSQAVAEAREDERKRVRLASLMRAVKRALPHQAKSQTAPVALAKLDHKHPRSGHREARVEQASLKSHKTPHLVEPPTRTHPVQPAPLQHSSGLMKVSTTRCASRDPGEALVCADPSLGAADRQMTRAYQSARAAGVPDAQLRQQQQRWLSARSSAAREAPWAVHDVYLARIAELNGQAREAHGDGY